MQLRAAGDYQGALTILGDLASRQPTTSNLSTLLDLQGLLKDQEGVDQTISRLTPLIQGWPDRLRSQNDLRLAAGIAEAKYLTGRQPAADSLWQKLELQARDEQRAQELFNSYRRVRRYGHAENYAYAIRGKFDHPGLWALNLASMFESQGHCLKAFEEYVLYLNTGKSAASLTARRFLMLADKCRDNEELFEHMYKAATSNHASGEAPLLALQILDVFVQTSHFSKAMELAWFIDEGAGGEIPFSLARTLVADHRGDMALGILQRLQSEARSVTQKQEFDLVLGQALAQDGHPQEAIRAYQRVTDRGGPMRWTANLEAARLLHRPLLQAEEAVRQLQELLRQAEQSEAQLLQIRLLGGLERYDEAERLRVRSMSRARGDTRIELEYLQIELALWHGDLSLARTALPQFLGSHSQHPLFNDAIELMDLLTFAATDSNAVVMAGRARRLAWLGYTNEALGAYQEASATSGAASEWLDWQAVELAVRELSAAAAIQVVEEYGRRHPDSIRLDRLAWYRAQLMEERGDTSQVLLAEYEALLQNWPETILQDQVRRKIRKLEETTSD